VKKCWIIPVLALLLSGCGAEPTFETIPDVCAETASQPARQILVELPEDAQVPALQSEEGSTLYFCDDYTVTAYTLPAGNLDETLRTTTGYGKDTIRVMQSYAPEGDCFACAWTAAGEGEMLVGSARIIDDGSYHYVVTVLSPESRSGAAQKEINAVLDSFRLESVNTDP